MGWSIYGLIRKTDRLERETRVCVSVIERERKSERNRERERERGWGEWRGPGVGEDGDSHKGG